MHAAARLLRVPHKAHHVARRVWGQGASIHSAFPLTMASEKKRVLIPGGAGYIGSHVALTVLNTRKFKVTSAYPIG